MTGAAQRFIEQTVGGVFTTREAVVTVTVAATQLLRNDPERVGWVITNTGSTRVNIGFRKSVPSAQTLPLQADGGGVSANVREDFVLPTFSVFGIVAAGTSTVHVIEIVRVSE